MNCVFLSIILTAYVMWFLLQKLSPLVWDGLTAYLQGVLLCVQRNRFIVTDSEHITAKLKVKSVCACVHACLPASLRACVCVCEGVIVSSFSLAQSLLDVFLTIKQAGLGSAGLHASRPKITHQLIYGAPPPFTLAIIELSTEMILATKTYPRHHRY